MTFVNILSTKKISFYYVIISGAYLLSLFVLPDGYWNYSPVFYMLFGPFILIVLNYYLGTQLNLYTAEKHPDLMEKYAIHFGIGKGQNLNQLNLLQNRKDFYKRDDDQLSRLLKLYIRSLTLFVISFATLSLVIVRIAMMWS
ncbi:MAG: hypothetical protein ACFHU9_00795 [Fluviicola sp.]